ncbi:phosphoenolpyruvate mutase [Pseudomonas sp. HY13-MNA-CIBAN-0226]|jgi:phosphoenolpyruvate phosphomutase|uniref:phosphoenolpyruvate mutase n=1 Tax=Pseudomonas sp. HY13-MNA-CIBAN-0226 TaxID=3140473 RepID=UPI003334A3E9
MKRELGNATAEVRGASLGKLLTCQDGLRVMEVHSPLSAMLVEKIFNIKNGVRTEFDAFWSSSLTDSTLLGKPDIELVSFSERFSKIAEIFQVTTKPLIFDADTGGAPEHLCHHVRTAEKLGISAFIVEDKTGLKKNSLLGTGALQVQASVIDFSKKISMAKSSQFTSSFLLIARIESLVLDAGMGDAIHRALAYVEAGADGIMIHSRDESGFSVLEFARVFRAHHKNIPLVCVPTTFNGVHYEALIDNGFNIVIYANHLLRAAYPAMRHVATEILKNGCTSKVEKHCLALNDILDLVPGTR